MVGRRNKSGFWFSVGYGGALMRWCVCMLRRKEESTFSDRSRLSFVIKSYKRKERFQFSRSKKFGRMTLLRALSFSDQDTSERSKGNKAENQ